MDLIGRQLKDEKKKEETKGEEEGMEPVGLPPSVDFPSSQSQPYKNNPFLISSPILQHQSASLYPSLPASSTPPPYSKEVKPPDDMPIQAPILQVQRGCLEVATLPPHPMILQHQTELADLARTLSEALVSTAGKVQTLTQDVSTLRTEHEQSCQVADLAPSGSKNPPSNIDITKSVPSPISWTGFAPYPEQAEESDSDEEADNNIQDNSIQWSRDQHIEASPLEGELCGQFSGTITRPVYQSTPSSTSQSSQQQPPQRKHTMKLRSTS